MGRHGRMQRDIGLVTVYLSGWGRPNPPRNDIVDSPSAMSHLIQFGRYLTNYHGFETRGPIR